ncbi:MAG: hypothetical protein ACRDSS_06855 [Actinocrinis sp.]
MLLYSLVPGVPAVGVGAFGQADYEILAGANGFTRAARSNGPVLLAMATGRVVSRDLRIPRLNVSPRFIVTPEKWWIAGRRGNDIYAYGAVRDIVGVFTMTDGLAIAVSETKSARFLIGRPYATGVKALVESVLAHAQLCRAPFENLAPEQRPLMLVGTHVGGHGTDLQSGEECVVAVSGRGICATGRGSAFLRAAGGLRAIQVGGFNEYTTGSGWAGGGSGTTGAREGTAFASLMNTLITRRHVDCLVRFVFDDAEVTFSLAGDTPQRLQLDASALLAALRDPSEVPNATAVNPAAVDQRGPEPVAQIDPFSEPASGFCGFCGARRNPAHIYCTGCGRAYGG